MIKRLIRQTYYSQFIRSVAVLTSGSILAQAIPVLTMPIFTRMFDAHIFGMLALLQVGGGLITILATGYYELAIPTVRQQQRAGGVASIAIAMATGISLLSLLLALLFREDILILLNAPEMRPWVYYCPLVIFNLSMMSIANYWLLRANRLVSQVIVQIFYTVGSALITLALGMLHMADGPLIGYLIGLTLGAGWGILQIWRSGFRFAWPASPRYISLMIRKYGHFPLYGSIPTAIQQIAAQVPLFIVARHYSLSAAGHYSVARNLLIAGVHLLTSCIGQVILKHLATLRQQEQRIWPYFLRITYWMAALSLLATAGVVLLGPWFFRLYLGSSWEEAAIITRLLGFNIFFWLMGMTLSTAAVSIHRIRPLAAWRLFYGFVAAGMFFFAALPFMQFIWYSVLLESAAYALYTVVIIATIYHADRSPIRHSTGI